MHRSNKEILSYGLGVATTGLVIFGAVLYNAADRREHSVFADVPPPLFLSPEEARARFDAREPMSDEVRMWVENPELFQLRYGRFGSETSLFIIDYGAENRQVGAVGQTAVDARALPSENAKIVTSFLPGESLDWRFELRIGDSVWGIVDEHVVPVRSFEDKLGLRYGSDFDVFEGLYVPIRNREKVSVNAQGPLTVPVSVNLWPFPRG